MELVELLDKLNEAALHVQRSVLILSHIGGEVYQDPESEISRELYLCAGLGEHLRNKILNHREAVISDVQELKVRIDGKEPKALCPNTETTKSEPVETATTPPQPPSPDESSAPAAA